MFRMGLAVFCFVLSASSFAGSVNCYVDKEMRFANGRPENHVLLETIIYNNDIETNIFDDSERIATSVVTTQFGGIIVSVYQDSNNDGRIDRETPALVLDVTRLMGAQSGKLSSDFGILASGNRIRLRCEGKI